MNIPRVWKWLLGTLSSVGLIWTAVKNVREILAFCAALNGWAVLAILCCFGLGFLVGEGTGIGAGVGLVIVVFGAGVTAGFSTTGWLAGLVVANVPKVFAMEE